MITIIIVIINACANGRNVFQTLGHWNKNIHFFIRHIEKHRNFAPAIGSLPHRAATGATVLAKRERLCDRSDSEVGLCGQ